MSRQEYHFRDGKSDKFWAIDVQGSSFTVQFGRTGTAGQTQTKEFDSNAEAQKTADKLIAEKTKKGYVAVGGTTAVTPSVAAAAAPAKGKKTVKTAPAPEETSAAPSPSALAVTRRIDLEPRDWLWATWRPRQPLPKPQQDSAPFDVGKGVARFLDALKKRPDDWFVWNWLRFKSPPSREEAHFWFTLVTSTLRVSKAPQKDMLKLAKQCFDGNLSVADVVKQINNRKNHFSDDNDIHCQLLPVLLTPAELIPLTADDVFPGDDNWRLRFTLGQTLIDDVFPYLTAGEVEELKPLLHGRLDPKDMPHNVQGVPKPAFRLAAALGMGPELEAVVNSWPAGAFERNLMWGEPQWIVFGLSDARRVDQQMRRLKLLPTTADHVRAWIAHTEYAGLDYIRDSIIARPNKPDAEKLFAAFRLVQAPEVAPQMLALRLNSKVATPASEWLDENPANAIAGLIPVAAGKDKLADAAIEYLRTAKKKGHADFIAEQLKSAPAAVASKVRDAVLGHEEKVHQMLDADSTPKPLRDAFTASTTAAKLPGWATPNVLPPILVGDRRLIDVQVSAVLEALRKTPLGTSERLLDALKQHADRAALDAFAWTLFEHWLAEGAPPKEKWALFAIGHLGGDASVLKLMPLVRAWPGESQHARAVLGLECLRAVGSDTALMQLNGIAQKLKFQGLKNKAKEFMDAIAKDKGLSREELEDRIVPDLDLDEKGSRVFDFGPRQFRVALSADLAPVVRDADGKVKADLPKPGAKDDTKKADAAVAEWKILKKQLREVLKVQVPRLEQAMVTGRRWPVEHFEKLLVHHPLMTHLASRVLWGGYDAKGNLTATFRVTEEQEYAGTDDQPLALKSLATVGIVHPLHLSAEQLARWGEVFADYEIITPFPQLGRPVLAPEPDEAKAKQVTRWAKAKLPPLAVRGTLEKLGWVRGSASDHGVVQNFAKQFPGANVTAFVDVEPGIPMGLPDWAGDQSIPRVFFLSGLHAAEHYPYRAEDSFLAWNKVDAVAVSEVLGDLTAVASKGN